MIALPISYCTAAADVLCPRLSVQFFITCGACEWLDGKHVVFGCVIDGMLTVRKMEAVPTGNNSRPKLSVTVAQCGEL
jgi:peptidyl-prolyl isomerase H (cyclophilin H)